MNTAARSQALPRDAIREPSGWCEGYDGLLMVAALALLGLGLVMVVSASIATAAADGGDPLRYLWRQGAFVAIALVAAGATMRLPMAVWQRSSAWLLAIGVGLLIAVLVPGVGRVVNGSTRWIALGAVNLQPSEAVKLCFVMYLAGYLVRREQQVRTLTRGFARPILVMVPIAALLLAEPDYGATVVMFATALGMLFLAGVPLRTFMLWALVIAGVLGVMVFAAAYRLERLMSFVNPWADPYGSGFQLTQALIAVGRGGLFGVGLGAGVQKLFYLPEAHTDFLFAVLAEELGLLGAVTVVALYTVVLWRTMTIARNASMLGQCFASHVAYGVALLVGLQAYVNLGVNLGLLPTKGLTLPLMSYGGSSLIANAVGVALVLRVGFETRGAGR